MSERKEKERRGIGVHIPRTKPGKKGEGQWRALFQRDRRPNACWKTKLLSPSCQA
jgi:hypothetical protein